VTATATSGLAVTLAVHANAASVCQLSGSASGSQVTFLGVGNCRIDANQAGDATYNAAAQQQQTFAVGQGAQTISFDSTAPAPAVAGGPSYQVLASATSGLAVSLSVDATAAAVCQLDGAASGSNVTFIGIGTCTLNANQSGNGDYAAATQVQQSFAVVPGPAAKLLFATEPGNVVRGDALGTIAVTETDTLGNVIDDNASLVTFKVAACSGNVLIGSATMTHGVATLSTATRFYTVTDPATLKVTAATGALSGDSSGFVVQANADLMFADAFESCRL